MNNTKELISTILTEWKNATSIEGAKVMQVSSDSDVNFDSDNVVTYYIGDDVPVYALGKDIVSQNTQVIVDIWTKKSKTGTQILNELVDKFLEYDYQLRFNADIIVQDRSYRHITTRFNY